MTLVQVLANEVSIHMACDFKLTDPYTSQVRKWDAHKLITVNKLPVSALIGVTGVANFDGKPVGDWIAETTARLGWQASVDDIVDALKQAEGPLSRTSDPVARRTTFVVASFVGSQSMVTLVSNFESFVKGQIASADTAGPALMISSIKPKGESFFATGQAGKVTSKDRASLKLSLRAGATDTKIHEELKRVNETVSRRTSTVSAGCYTASLHATGRGSTQPFLTDKQTGDFIPPESADVIKSLGSRLPRQIGPDGKPIPIRLVQSGSAVSIATPEFFREQLKLRPDDAEVWNNYGGFLWDRRQFEKALNAFRRAVELNPSFPNALANLAHKLWVLKGDTAEADRLYARAVEASTPTAPGWLLSDYAVLCDQGLSDFQRAAELHERAAQDQNFALARARQGLFMLKNGTDPHRARSLIAAALEEQPENPYILYEAAWADWLYNKEPDAAVAKLHKACTLDPGNVATLRFAAQVCIRQRDFASAAYYYRKVIKRAQHDAMAHSDYALILLIQGKPEGALRHLSKAANCSPDPQTSLLIQTNRAATLWALRRQAEAVALMRRILDSAPPPSIQLELLAMLQVAAPGTDTEQLIRKLIGSGAQCDGTLIRIIARNKPPAERDAGNRLADIVEGKVKFPPSP